MPMPNTRIGAPSIAGTLPGSFSNAGPMGLPFTSMSTGPSINPSAPFPDGSSPSLYNRGSQPGMLWAQETIPQMYLHKVHFGKRSNHGHSDAFKALVTELWKDISQNVRGQMNSNTPQWPLFIISSEKEYTGIDPADVTNKDILKFRGMTGQFVTWQSLNTYLLATTEEQRLQDNMQTAEFPKGITTAESYAHSLTQAPIIYVNFVGVLKNIPTGGVGCNSVSMNTISGGRVTMVNHWGVHCI
ncbi:hypothetical protein CYMTET_28794 [Cymbomonas tetramitiformis]|nr:hypothetical protein CYMTET_28794 [Cymbomonas tetramitiformis]